MFTKARLSMSPALNAVDASGLRDFLRTRDLTENSLPEHLWHSVVHEFTHHWEFFGPVGSALNVLYLKQFQQVVEATLNEEPVDYLLARTRNALFVNNVVLACLKPIAEGLALFAEHDLEPSTVPVESSVLSWARILFTKQSGLAGASEEETIHQLDKRMKRFLESARLSVLGVDRKADLLAERFDEAATDLHVENDAWECYLGGYLYIKSFQRAKITSESRLFSGCVLIMLIETLMFNDYALVDVLLESLDSGYSHTDVASRITNVIAHRLRELLGGDVSAMVDEVVARALGESNADSTVPLPSGVQAAVLEDGTNLADRWRRGVDRLEAETAALTSGASAEAEIARLVLQQREVFVLFRSEYACVTSNGFLVPKNERREYQEFPLVSAEKVGLEPDGASADAVFEVVIFPARWQLVAIHYVNDQLVDKWPLWVIGGSHENVAIEQVVANRAVAVAEQRKLASTWEALSELRRANLGRSSPKGCGADGRPGLLSVQHRADRTRDVPERFQRSQERCCGRHAACGRPAEADELSRHRRSRQAAEGGRGDASRPIRHRPCRGRHLAPGRGRAVRHGLESGRCGSGDAAA